MAVGINDFFKLAVKSGAVTSEQAHALYRKYTAERESANGDAASLAEWLVEGNVLSRYQARVLLKGLAGPFRFGDYRIADRFADSQFKQSFSAVHAPTGHRVVLRFYDAKLFSDESQWQAVRETVETLARLRSPRLQKYYQWVEEGSYRFAVVQYLEGRRCSDELGEGAALDWEATLRLIRQVAEGLIEIGLLERAHGDVRPESIWRTPHGCAYLLTEPICWKTPLSLVASSELDRKRLDYLAPELTVAGQSPSVQTDLYALGCTAYELLSGRPPFAGADGAAKIEAHVRQTPAPLADDRCPEPVRKLVNRLMAKNPQVRFHSAQELIEAVNALLPTSDPLPIPSATQAAYESSLEATPEVPPPVGEPLEGTAAGLNASAEAPGEPVVESAGTSAQPTAAPEPSLSPEAPIVVSDADSGSRRRRRRKRSYLLYVWIALGLCGALAAVFAFYPSLFRGSVASPEPAPEHVEDRQDEPSTKTPPGPEEPVEEAAAGPVLVEDDGTALWADPLAGEPISLAYLPPGAQLFIHSRPADLLAVEAETKFLAALGPRVEHYRRAFEGQFKLAWKDIDRLVIAFAGADMAFPRPAIVVHLREPVDEAELIERWGNPPAEAISGKRTYPVGDWRVYLPPAEKGRVVVLASPDELADVIEFDGAPPVLLRQLTRLVQQSNDRHHVTVVGVPSYLTNNILRDDFDFYFGDAGKVREALSAMLLDEVNAFALSVALSDPVYMELRLSIGSAPDAVALLAKQRERFHSMPDWVEDRLSSTTVPEYWRRVALRFPQMLRFMDEYLRGGVEDRELIFNVVQPKVAPQNLLVGAEMLLMLGEATTTEAPAKPTKKTPANMTELLAAKLTMMFDQQPLDFAINDLQAIVKDEFPDLAFPFAIKILGNDLQLAGITQNQQIVNFNEQNKSLAEILTSIVMKANPITTVKKPSEEDQKLIWVVGPDPENASRQIILITTRDGAKTKSFTLPKVFQPAEN